VIDLTDALIDDARQRVAVHGIKALMPVATSIPKRFRTTRMTGWKGGPVCTVIGKTPEGRVILEVPCVSVLRLAEKESKGASNV